jgi:hypothetical protein
MPQHEPATFDELEARYETIMNSMGMGVTMAQFVRWARLNTDWKVSDRQVRNYWHETEKRLTKAVTEQTGRSPVLEYARHLERMDYLYRSAVTEKDYRTALSVARDYADFRDLKNPENQIDWRSVASALGLSTEATEHLEMLDERTARLSQNGADNE